jgi:copper chaperone CopZ
VTFVLLGLAFYFTYRKPKVAVGAASGAGDACCAVPETESASEACCPPDKAKGFTLKKLNKTMLWVVTVIVLAFAFFPNYMGCCLLSGGDTLAARDDFDRVAVHVDGMTCEACAANIENSLRKVIGVAAAEVNYERSEALVGVPKGTEPPREAILAAIAAAGSYTGRFTDQILWTLGIEGMTCEGCAAGLQAALSKVPGVTSASVSYEQGQARIAAGSSVSEEALRKAVSDAGYTLKSAAKR